MSRQTILLFGGNGFVGTAIAKLLVQGGHKVSCISRSGHQPVHLENEQWAQEVNWLKGDARQPDRALFESVDVAMALIGTPPVPTFSKDKRQQQCDNNSLPNIAVIKACQEFGVNKVVILGAHLPKLIDRDSFGYAMGKKLVFNTAQEFTNSSENRTAIILKPTAIYGLRHSKEGKPVNIAGFMKPIAKFHGYLPGVFKMILPEQFVSVDAVAAAAVDACINDKYSGKCNVVSNQEILAFEI